MQDENGGIMDLEKTPPKVVEKRVARATRRSLHRKVGVSLHDQELQKGIELDLVRKFVHDKRKERWHSMLCMQGERAEPGTLDMRSDCLVAVTSKQRPQLHRHESAGAPLARCASSPCGGQLG